MTDDGSKKSLSYLPRSYAGQSRDKTRQGTEHEGEQQTTAEKDYPHVADHTLPADLPADCPVPGEAEPPSGEQTCYPGSILEDEGPDELGDDLAPCPFSSLGDQHRQSVVTVKVNLVGVRFGCAGKIYHFDAGGLDIKRNDWVVVRTEKGMALGQAAVPPFEVEMEPHQLDDIRRVIRKAERADFEQRARCRKREIEAYRFCNTRIEMLNLAMKLVAVECYFDYSKYVFYFTAEGRIDFRELVKQLVARFPVRIEMRQIGVRHEAKMLGGIGCCGQELCCSRFLTEFRPVSVKMAKRQNLSLNPTKISGVCGRLMCCLSYEHETYEEFRREVPKEGKHINTVYGPGIIVKHNPLEQTITVRLGEDNMVEIRKEEIVSPDEIPPKTNEAAKKERTTQPFGPRRRRGESKPSGTS